MSQDIDQRTLHMSPKESGDYAEYQMLDKPDGESDYRNSPVAFKGAQGNLTPSVVSNTKNPSKVVDDVEDWDFDNSDGEKSAQRVALKRRFEDLLNECRTYK